MTLQKVLYRTQATANGGREGRAVSSDGILDVKLAMPRELGGAGGAATNPEQLFAAGYSACFLSALKFASIQSKQPLPADASVTAKVGIGPVTGGFGFEVELDVSLPGVEGEAAHALVEAAHKACPYSNATRGNIEVRLTVL